MSNALTQEPPFSAEEGAPHSTPAYCYVIQRVDGTSAFFTSRKRPVTLAGLPDEMNADDPQEFTPAQIKHGQVKGGDRFETQNTFIAVNVENDTLQRYLLTAAAVKLKAWIIRANAEGLAGAIDFGENAIIVQSGILGKFTFKGNATQVELTPEPFYVEGKIPRYYFGRTCQHALYGPACLVDPAAFDWETTILDVDPSQRTVTLTGQRPDSIATFFSAGQLVVPSLLARLSVAWSAFDGGDTVLKLAVWHPELAAALAVTAQAGCLRIVDGGATGMGCRQFDNVANFGGFPLVPNKSPLQGLG